jgi:flagellar biosynthesis/type III secretory pathway protein FliH
MAETVTIQFEKPIASVGFAGDYDNAGCSSGYGQKTFDERMQETIQLRSQKAELSRLCQTVKNLAEKLGQFYDSIFAGHKEEIAKLSVEIARKILAQKVGDGDYQIEAIIQEALKNAPTRQDMVIHLNPEDFARCQKIQQDESGIFAGIKLASDPNIGRAECVIETPKGIIESMINEHLEKIGKALKKAE